MNGGKGVVVEILRNCWTEIVRHPIMNYAHKVTAFEFIVYYIQIKQFKINFKNF